jgi:hypothetical protein
MGTDHRPEPTVFPNQAPGAWGPKTAETLPAQERRRGAPPTCLPGREDRPVGRVTMVQP